MIDMSDHVDVTSSNRLTVPSADQPSSSTTDSTSKDVAEPETEVTSSPATSTNCVCRDFLRNVCRRGSKCRFLHPADPTSARRDVIMAAANQRPLVFCHDFQNAAGCKRGGSCRFIHCTRDEEATYRRTGLLPVHVHRKLALDAAVTRALLRGETPVCLDFIKAGGCRRANGKCRYRHVTADEFEREQMAVNDRQQHNQSAVNTENDRQAALLYRKRKLTPDDNNCFSGIGVDDVINSSGGAKFTVTAVVPAVGGQVIDQLPAAVTLLDPVCQTGSYWPPPPTSDYRSSFCVGGGTGRTCRLVAIPQATFSLGSPPNHVTMLTAPAALGLLGLTVVQPFV